MKIQRMRIACWIPKATYIHFEYVTLIAFPPQQDCRNAPYCCIIRTWRTLSAINPLTPNDPYCGRTTPLTSKRYILYI